MRWVSDKEEWLVEWNDAKRLGESVFQRPSTEGAEATLVAVARNAEQSNGHPTETFFSDVIEVAFRCLVCRVCGDVVDIFDVSPTAESVVSWRVCLPSPIVPFFGISHFFHDRETGLTLLFLTEMHIVHKVRVVFGDVGRFQAHAESSTFCNLASPPSAFCALDSDRVAVGCASGALHAIHLCERDSAVSSSYTGYEFVEVSRFRRRLCGGAAVAPSPVLALAAAGPSATGGRFLLALSADGQLRVWEAQEGSGRIVAAQDIQGPQYASSLVGTAPACMRVSPSCTRACLVLGNTIRLVDLQPEISGGCSGNVGMTCSKVQPPFAQAFPTHAVLSDSALWSAWSNQNRTQLFRMDLAAGSSSQSRVRHAVAASNLDAGTPVSRLAAEGCDREDSTAGGSRSHQMVFMLSHQHGVWRAEEDGFDVSRLVTMFDEHKRCRAVSGEKRADFVDDGIGSSYCESPNCGAGIEERVLAWWVGRVFIPGRYSDAIVLAALRKAGVPIATDKLGSHDELRAIVEAHFKKHVATHGGRLRPTQQASGSPVEAAAALVIAAAEFLLHCDAVWMQTRQLRGVVVSGSWAQHTWNTMCNDCSQQITPPACPLLLSEAGVSCIRPVQCWPERWWTTLHVMRDLSNYQHVELENVLELSLMDEWKLCVTAWFLSQFAGNSNVSMALGMLKRGSFPSTLAEQFVHGLPPCVINELSRCARFHSNDVTSELENIRQLVESFTVLHDREVVVFGASLNTLTGIVSNHSMNERPCKLTDVLRGSIATSESEYVCAAMRDLLLLCVYGRSVAGQGMLHSLADTTSWSSLTCLLDRQLPLSVALLQSMRSRDGTTRVCGSHLWAASFRVAVMGSDTVHGPDVCVRVPLASFRAPFYATHLLRCQSWGALRAWSMHQDDREIVVYFAGREWLAQECYQQASQAFVEAAGCASRIAKYLSRVGLWEGFNVDYSREDISYYVHVASLFRTRCRPQEEFHFAQAAALAADCDQHVDKQVRQQLWTEVFPLAVDLEKWKEACDALMHIESFQSQLRLLGARLRSHGCVEVILTLSSQHRAAFLNSLHEQASTEVPVVGSDSLACYKLLYAFHFSSGEFLKAATVAQMLYRALDDSLLRALSSDADTNGTASFRPEWCTTGDCTSDPRDLPRANGEPFDAGGGGSANLRDTEEVSESMLCDPPPPWEASTFARSVHLALPLLEQQRSALLMLVSALRLTQDKLLVIPPPHAPMLVDFTGTASGTEGSVDDDENLDELRTWFSTAERAGGNAQTVSLDEVERVLALVEARTLLSRGSDLREPVDVARCLASLGLLALSLQICLCHGLDMWHCALLPFTRLCLTSARTGDDITGNTQIALLAGAAVGSSQTFMFVRSDGGEPLGSGGSLHRGLWHMLREGMARAADWTRTLEEKGASPAAIAASAATATTAIPSAAAGSLTASGVRFYSLVADELLRSSRDEHGKQHAGGKCKRLPTFVSETLSAGPSWVCLLRLFMKHACFEDAVDLLSTQLKRCCAVAVGRTWSPLQDFPVALVAQFRGWLGQRADEERHRSDYALYLRALDAILAQFKALLFEEAEA
eukprot:TRINITY_DN43171_c0_g1_i1.p1 TRINITY_DN43171_c0_g1~~TRINITY_DN43171_c0_g1_i1.p1  ORF type:complete len:1573 (+),score=263.95 TRINITY_DN43171_c0_g1_i1:65-4783(+)